MTLKSNRTIFCSGFDKAVLSFYTNKDIQNYLEEREWDVANVYIMKSKTSLKIEFQNTKQATAFLQNTNTSICNIMVTQEQKER